MTIPDSLARLAALAKAATPPGELIRYAHGGGRLVVMEPERQLIADFYDEKNREFYAGARAGILALLDRLELAERNAATFERACIANAGDPEAGRGALMLIARIHQLADDWLAMKAIAAQKQVAAEGKT